MSVIHKQIEEWIRNIEEEGADGDFFTYLSEDEINLRMSGKVCYELNKIMGKDNCYDLYGAELAYDKLKVDEKQKVFNDFLSYLKSTYLNWEKEKIKLVSKTKLRKIIKYEKELAKLYEYKFAKISLLKSGSIAAAYENEVIKTLCDEYMLNLNCALGITEKSWNMIELNHNGALLLKRPNENETDYDFIVRSIDEINEKNEFIEFVWDKDEE